MLRKLRGLINRGRLDADLKDELEAHLALKQARLEAEGLSAAEARRQAVLAMGESSRVARDGARGVDVSEDGESLAGRGVWGADRAQRQVVRGSRAGDVGDWDWR
ncbi:MAG: hypothetical protein HY820_33925 [Acidobacteria bacterium]|nr:hypothetical protein [Acidobacteriota bacterium]